jgi:hypothetical protein
MRCRECGDSVVVSTEFEFVVQSPDRWRLIEYKIAECGCTTTVIDRTGHRLSALPNAWTTTEEP